MWKIVRMSLSFVVQPLTKTGLSGGAEATAQANVSSFRKCLHVGYFARTHVRQGRMGAS